MSSISRIPAQFVRSLGCHRNPSVLASSVVQHLHCNKLHTTEVTNNQENIERPKVPHRGKYDAVSGAKRLKWLEDFTDTKMSAVVHEDHTLFKGNIEGPIGSVKIPLAVAGPLLFKGDHVEGYRLLAMATMTKSLVDSATRGAACVNEAGGVETFAGEQQAMRSPMFVTGSPQEAHAFGSWLRDQVDVLMRDVIPKTSNFMKLKRIHTIYDHGNCHAWFAYTTGDAAGSNAVADCTFSCMHWIIEKVKTELPEVNLITACNEARSCGDKQMSAGHATLGRGVTCCATADISESLLQKHFNVSSEAMVELFEIFLQTSMRTHVSVNINLASLLAGVFTATGQDVASMPEATTGALTIEYNRKEGYDGITMKLHMPVLAIGTVGGGTVLPTQQDALSIMGCRGTGNVRKLAEIIAGYCLAHELSALSTIAANDFVAAFNKKKT